MKRIDTGRAANAYGGPAGGTGHWQDTDPTGGTQFDAEWCEGVQEALCGAIEGLGGVLAGDETGQLWGLLSHRVDGILSDATDTGVDTTKHKRVLIACSNSQASGVHTAVIASGGTSATMLDAAAVACQDSTVRREAVLLASRNAQLYDAKRIGWGYDTGAAIVPGVVNQNLTGIIHTDTGDVHLGGDLLIGGDVDAGTGDLCQIDASTGSIQTAGGVDATGAITADGKVTATGGLAVGYDTDANHDPATVNAPSGKVTEFWISGSIWSSGGIQTQTVNCDKVGADSIVLVSVQAHDGSPAVYRNLSCGVREQAAGSFTIWARNEGTDLTDPSIAWRFVVINPV